MLDKDYIVREIWSDWWNGKGDDGLIFPEASYKHHILTEWVNDKIYGIGGMVLAGFLIKKKRG